MELVTPRDVEDAKALGERSGIDMMDDWDQFIHDIAQAIADGRRPVPRQMLLTPEEIVAVVNDG
jgi:hypothetical protein